MFLVVYLATIVDDKQAADHRHWHKPTLHYMLLVGENEKCIFVYISAAIVHQKSSSLVRFASQLD